MLNESAMMANHIVPLAQELSDENLDSLFGGQKENSCGCGWLCSATGECGCSNGHTICLC